MTVPYGSRWSFSLPKRPKPKHAQQIHRPRISIYVLVKQPRLNTQRFWHTDLQPVLWSPPFLDTPQQLERVCSRSPASSLGVFLALTKCADMINKSHTGPLEKRETEWNGLQGIKKTSGGGTGACLLRRKWLIETHYYKTLTTGDDCASSPWVQM